MSLSLEDLPEEIVEILAEFLSLDDVRACSSVSTNWRAIFNNNRIWKRYRTFHPDYFRKQKNKLSCSSCEGCEEKQHIFRELRVHSNLLNGIFDVAEVKTDRLICWNLTDTVDEVGNHWLFILGAVEFNGSNTKCVLQAWKLNNEPFLTSSFENILLGEVQDVNLKLNINKVFIVLKKSTLVFEFRCPQFQLKFLFKVVVPKVLEPFRSRFVCTNNLILCFFHKIFNNTKSVSANIHVWNEEGSLVYKSGSFPCEEVNATMFYLRAVEADNSDCVLVATKLISCSTGEGKDVLELFSVKKFQYTTILNEKENRSLDFMLVFGSIVCVLYQQQYTSLTVLKCFNCSGEVMFYTTLVEPAIEWKMFANCHSDKILLLGNNTILVLDIKQQSKISRFKIGSELGSLCKALSLKNNLLFVQGSSYDQVTNAVFNLSTGQQVKNLNNFPPCKTSFCSLSCNGNVKNRSPPKIIVNTCQEEVRGSSQSRRVFVVSFW